MTATLLEAFTANRTAIDAAAHYDRNQFARTARDSFARDHGGTAIELAKRIASNCLTHDERIALASHLIDYLDGVDDDDRNAAVDAIGALA